MKKKNIFSLRIITWFVICVLIAPGCQNINLFKRKNIMSSLNRLESIQEPPASLPRSEALPLVAAIPGLNLPLAPVGSAQFGQLIELLEKEGFPAFIVAYDEKLHPVSDLAGLYFEQNSIAMTRVIPTLSSAVEKENEIRKAQNVERLKELVLVGYSQGSVLALDVLRKLIVYKQKWTSFLADVGAEWDWLKEDPEFQLLRSRIESYLVFKNIKVQREQQFNRDYDFRRLYDRFSTELTRSWDRFYVYITSPEEIFPNVPIFSDKKKGYPRRYTKMATWLETQNRLASVEGEPLPLEFLMRYVDFEELMSLNIRFFSLAGSFFGAAAANKFYPVMKVLPVKMDAAFAGPIEGQIKDTQLGSSAHLKVVKALIKHGSQLGEEKAYEMVYFIVGANGNKGDGIVGQSSAHFSGHLLTEIKINELFEEGGSNPIRFQSQKIPSYPVTGLKVHHLPEKKFIFFKEPGVAQISDQSQAYPYLLSFLKKDFNALRALHQEESERLTQFMVVLDLPSTGEIKRSGVVLNSHLKGVKIAKRFYNPSSNTIIWTGFFQTKQFLIFDQSQRSRSGKVLLKIKQNGQKEANIELDIKGGKNHFVQIKSEKSVSANSSSPMNSQSK